VLYTCKAWCKDANIRLKRWSDCWHIRFDCWQICWFLSNGRYLTHSFSKIVAVRNDPKILLL